MSVAERPPELASSAFSNPPYWLLVGGESEAGSRRVTDNQKAAAPEVLSLDLADGRVLPVFGSQQSAAEFLSAWLSYPVADEAAEALVEAHTNTAGASTVDGDWKLRGTGAGELVSLLSGSAFSAGSCAGVERVALDPPPELVDGIRHGITEGHVGGLISVSRRCFLERLMGRNRTWFESTQQSESL